MTKIFIISISVALVAASCSNSQTVNSKKTVSSEITNEKTIEVVGKELAPGVIELPKNQVCMVNDAFKTSEQIPVVVNGKTYYGCCQGCVDGLKTNESARTTTDFTSGEIIDKANAVIILKPGSDEEVLYFSSAVNAVKYVKGQAYISSYLKNLEENQNPTSSK